MTLERDVYGVSIPDLRRLARKANRGGALLSGEELGDLVREAMVARQLRQAEAVRQRQAEALRGGAS